MCERTQTKTGCGVWLYARSGENDRQILADQMEDLLEHAKQHGYSVVGTSQDLAQGKGLRRKGIKQMMRAVQKGEVRGVVVRDVERFSYDSNELLRVLNFLQQHNVVLVTTESDLQYELSLRGLGSRTGRKKSVRWGLL